MNVYDVVTVAVVMLLKYAYAVHVLNTAQLL